MGQWIRPADRKKGSSPEGWWSRSVSSTLAKWPEDGNKNGMFPLGSLTEEQWSVPGEETNKYVYN